MSLLVDTLVVLLLLVTIECPLNWTTRLSPSYKFMNIWTTTGLCFSPHHFNSIHLSPSDHNWTKH